MTDVQGFTIMVGLITVVINLMITGIGIKIYTEYVKDKLQDKRKGEPMK
jgi:Tfp pilus assembly major pilin PilA